MRCAAGDGAIDQQRLGRPTNAGAPHLGVEHDLLGHIEPGGLVDIDMADALEVGKNRHPRLGLHPPDQALAAARHQHVDRPVEPLQHHADGRPVAGRDDLDRILRQSGGAQAFRQRSVDCPRRAQAFRAAAQNGGISRLEAECAGIGRDIGAAFIDHADDAERHPHALDADAVRAGSRPR